MSALPAKWCGIRTLTPIGQFPRPSTDAARKLHDAGNIKDLDYASQQVLYEQSKIDLAQAEAEVLDARERLNALMGLWGPDAGRWTVAQPLPELPQNEVAPVGLET